MQRWILDHPFHLLLCPMVYGLATDAISKFEINNIVLLMHVSVFVHPVATFTSEAELKSRVTLNSVDTCLMSLLEAVIGQHMWSFFTFLSIQMIYDKQA